MCIQNVVCIRLVGQPDVLTAIEFDTADLEACVRNLPEVFKISRPRSLMPVQTGPDQIAFKIAPYNMWDEDDESEVVLRRDQIATITRAPKQLAASYMETVTTIALPNTLM